MNTVGAPAPSAGAYVHTFINTHIYIYIYYVLLLLLLLLLLLFSTAAFKAYCAIWVRRSNFRHQASPRVSPRESTQRRMVELWARNVREFCLNANFHLTFRDLLHAVKLRHGKACWGFFCPKNLTASDGCEPANFGTKGQHATSRPPKPLYIT